uniref:mRNA-capping enzyme n=1 Tax=Syphacia muris TaxID=451379 RepID=A0A0N5AHZ1_9BILA
MAPSIYPDPEGPNHQNIHHGPPDRWMYCPKVGKASFLCFKKVIAEHFLPFKTPLCSMYDDQVEKQYRFHPLDVFSTKLKGVKPGAKIGLWLDLTKTKRYYSRKEVENNDCIYKKLPLKGHGSTPTEEETENFCQEVSAFLKDNPKGVVAVHCTHGFNRTGFLIAAYLVEELGWAIDAAIGNFAVCRPNGIYKQDYIDELFMRYGDIDDRIQAPPRPAWETGPIEDSDADVNIADDKTEQPSSSTTNGSPPEAKKSNVPQFMDGKVPCVTYVTDKLLREQLQSMIADMCGSKKSGFPGCQPVSMECTPEKNNMQLIVQNEYLFSWKADGVRYLVLINDEDKVFAFDRDNNVFRIPDVTFLCARKNRHLKSTLVDAEMIIDKVKGQNGKEIQVPRLLIYDVIRIDGVDTKDWNFKKRMDCIYKEIIAPRTKAMESGRILRDSEPISIRIKDFWPLRQVRKVFDPKFLNAVGHDIDGLIFQPVNEPYRPGRLDTLLKWKPSTHNSIDFKLKIVREERPGELPEYVGYLYVQHEKDPVDKMKATKKLLPYDNKIIECRYANNKWEFMRERTDKSLPNSRATAQSVFNSIRNPITKDFLIDFIERNCVRRGTKRSLQ